ncbi:MAG: hypothetical protein FJY20_12145 [Bacteroidetes bacterium]|nr:hypothetical protein [Bacteroidota bacterium]
MFDGFQVLHTSFFRQSLQGFFIQKKFAPQRTVNAVLNKFNSTMSELNKQANAALNDWNKTYSKYMDEYMPRQQRN